MKKHLKWAVPILAGVLVSLIPVPKGLDPMAWYYFAIFLATILALVFEPLPAAVCGLLGVSLAAALTLVPMSQPPAAPAPKPAAEASQQAKPAGTVENVLKPGDASAASARVEPAKEPEAKPAQPKKPTAADQIKWALSGFSDSTVWLIFVAFILGLGYEKTGLGKRIALLLMKKLGRSTLGLGYAVALSDLALAPFLPSNTARSGGTIYPIIKNIPVLYGSTPENEPRKIGSYLMWVALASTCVTSGAFLTSFAPNVLALSMTQKLANIDISWTEWFVNMLPVSVVLFIVTPLLVYKIYPPTLKQSEEAPIWAGKELEALGPMSRKEITLAVLALVSLCLWIFGGSWMNATTVALAAMGVMVLTKIVSWDDILSNKSAWNILFWYGTLMAIADGLNKVGFLKWFCQNLAGSLQGFGVVVIIILLVTVFWYASFFFASVTALVTALLPPFLMAALLVPGLPVKILIILMCGSLGLRGILTPYAVAPAIIYYGSGYISPRDHWRLGFIFSTFFLVVFLAVAMPYLFMLYK